MSNKQGKRYSEEFKRDAVALASSSSYNRRRLRKHPDWGYLTPNETRQRHTLAV
ncbi:hypothetical protein [Streptomyces sp. NBC_01198]|uniref:hypothetical protein n=1 Tax=Streptomyces sp. NBC_01198 TaxID=2903769 RepID=UPI002E160BA7|nr:hypothetical protein OG702_06910 [Streptomyces sp. NBC_01198]